MSQCPALERGARCRLPLGHSTMHQYVELRRRKRLRPIGRKAKRERAELDRCREAVQARANGLCEAWTRCLRPRDEEHRERVLDLIMNDVYPNDCSIVVHVGEEMHHLRKADRDEGRHDPDRCVWLCAAAHRWVETHPDEARAVGLWVDSWEEIAS